MSEHEHTTHQSVWDTDKIVLKGKFIVLNAYFRKEDRSQIIHLNPYLKNSEREEQNKQKPNRRKEIIKLTIEINKVKNQKMTEKTNETQREFFEKINNIKKFQQN